MQSTSRTYRVLYDDDLDMWSVVTAPFDGIYFKGTKPLCEKFVADRNEHPWIAAVSGKLATSCETHIPKLHMSAFGLVFSASRRATT
jgi:hypothetical protein